MGIQFNIESRTFHLQAKDSSYLLQITPYQYVAHLYWGKKIGGWQGANPIRYVDRGFAPNPIPGNRDFSLDTIPLEYPSYGNSDYREPAIQIQFENGSTVSDFRYVSHEIYRGKPKLEGLPATYVDQEDEAETLALQLVDELTKLRVELLYTVFEEHNVITRSAQIINEGYQPVKLLRALSASVDFRDADFELLHLSGSWANERNIVRRKLVQGTHSIESKRGASSHQHNPFLALLRPGTNEDHGEVYGFNLVYSGNFTAQVETDQFNAARVSIGINPFDFTWLLEPGESFQTPEVVMVYSDMGLTGMSGTFHKLYRTRLIRGTHRDAHRPILINNWEATYFDFNAEKIESIASKGRELGMELFVLDDGWFGKRDDDKTSLGDWFVDKRKLPGGLEDLVARVTKTGMQFGIWFEPEMISEESDLYRQHPDWCLHVPGRLRSSGRDQYVLDLSRKDVRDAVVEMVGDVLSSAPISYVKWDMNRHMTEIGSAALPPQRQRETAHRYMLGLYEMMEELVTRFPQVLFESCSGGGGRFDPGMLYYMPQVWTSDNTDAVCRLKIQYGTSLVYPIGAMGAHVSAVPNHQVERITPLKMRGNVAMSGNFGYELDLTAMPEDEQEMVKQQVEFYKDIRPLVQFGDFYRLLSPFEGNEAAWMFVSADRSEAMFAYYRVLALPNASLRSIRLKGLDPDALYRVDGLDEPIGGDELMYSGVMIPHQSGDFFSVVGRLRIVT